MFFFSSAKINCFGTYKKRGVAQRSRTQPHFQRELLEGSGRLAKRLHPSPLSKRLQETAGTCYNIICKGKFDHEWTDVVERKIDMNNNNPVHFC